MTYAAGDTKSNAEASSDSRQQVELPPFGDDWVAAALELRPLLEEAAPRIDADQRLTDEVVAALHEKGGFRLLVPWELGGYQVDPATFVEFVEALAFADASTAWIVSQCSICSMAAAYLPREAGMEIVGNAPDTVLAWGAAPAGKAIREDGGWRITGKWFFASGSRHATWMGGRCPLFEADDTPILNEDGTPSVRMFLFPKSAVEVHPSWDVMGLRGTGSDSYSVAQLFVPDDRKFNVDVRAGHPGRLYQIVNRHLFAPGVAGVTLGMARATLDAFVKIASDPKKGHKDSTAILSALGAAEGKWRRSRSYLYQALREQWQDILRGGTETTEHQINIRCASTLAIHECKAIMDFAFHEAGAVVLLESLPFERRMRDIHAALQHGQSKRSNFETVGRYALGLDPGPLIL